MSHLLFLSLQADGAAGLSPGLSYSVSLGDAGSAKIFSFGHPHKQSSPAKHRLFRLLLPPHALQASAPCSLTPPDCGCKATPGLTQLAEGRAGLCEASRTRVTSCFPAVKAAQDHADQRGSAAASRSCPPLRCLSKLSTHQAEASSTTR